jgi:hypothetical protein
LITSLVKFLFLQNLITLERSIQQFQLTFSVVPRSGLELSKNLIDFLPARQHQNPLAPPPAAAALRSRRRPLPTRQIRPLPVSGGTPTFSLELARARPHPSRAHRPLNHAFLLLCSFPQYPGPTDQTLAAGEAAVGNRQRDYPTTRPKAPAREKGSRQQAAGSNPRLGIELVPQTHTIKRRLFDGNPHLISLHSGTVACTSRALTWGHCFGGDVFFLFCFFFE